MNPTPIRRAELVGYAVEFAERKRAAQAAIHQRMAADLVENILKPRVIRAAKEGVYQVEFPIMYSTKDILPEVMEAVGMTFPDLRTTLKNLETHSPALVLDWA
jgi:hypothetical protein